MKKFSILIVWLFAAVLSSGCASVADDRSISDDRAFIRLEVSAPSADSVGADCVGLPLCVAIDLPEAFSRVPLHEIVATVAPAGESDAAVPAQLECCREGKIRLWWVVDRAGAGKTSKWVVTLDRGLRLKARPSGAGSGFAWQDSAGEYIDLLLDGRTALRTMYAHDRATPERQHATYKVYHHVFDATGEKPITKGPGGLYTHHRGLFIGWNRLTLDGAEGDWWHMKEGSQQHREFISNVAGPVWARSIMAIDWVDGAGRTVIAEKRSITVYRQPEPGLLLIDFHTRLKAALGEVFLNGDPEHAGFQFRAHNDVAEGDATVKAVYHFDRDGVDAKKDFDLPWAGMNYGLYGQRFSVQYMNHPGNPTPTVYSAYRDYGRFGSYFKKTIPAGETLELRYRVYVGTGSMPDRDEMAGRYTGFVDPPTVGLVDPPTVKVVGGS